MKISKKQILVASFLCFMFLGILSLRVVSAATGDGLQGQVGMDEIAVEYGQDSQAPTDVVTIVVRVINYSLYLLGAIFLALLVFSGYQWMTAGGDEDAISTAKNRMKNAVIGLVVVLMSWTITYFLFYKVIMPATTGNDATRWEYDTNPNTF